MESLAARLDQLAPQIRSVDQLSQTDLRKLLEVIGDWSAAHGLLVVDPKTVRIYLFLIEMICRCVETC